MNKKSTLTLVSLIIPFLAQADDHNLFTAEDVFELEYANNPRISPDGSRIVYERRSNDIMTDSTRSNLWIIDSDGGQHRPLVSGTQSASSLRWSADGDRIAYIQSTDSGTGIYVRWISSGSTALVANLRKSPSDLTWSPDGRWLAFTMDVPKKSEPIAKPRSKPEGAEWFQHIRRPRSNHRHS